MFRPQPPAASPARAGLAADGRSMSMRLALSTLAVFALVAAAVLSPQLQSALVGGEVLAQDGNVPPPNPNCSPYGTTTPEGVETPVPSDEPSRPVWCYSATPSASTNASGSNDWVDTYDNNGPAIQPIPPSYHVFSAT